MDSNNQPQTTWTSRRVIATLAVTGLLLYIIFWTPPVLGIFFSRIAGIIAMVVLAIALAYIISPAVERLSQVRLPLSQHNRRALAAVVVMLIGAGLIVLIVMTTSSAISEDVEEVATLVKDFTKNQLPVLIEEWRFEERIEKWMQDYPDLTPDSVRATIAKRAGAWTESVLTLVARVPAWAAPKAIFIISLVLVPFLAFYFVTDSRKIRASALALLPLGYRENANELIGRINATNHHYVRGMLLVCLIIGAATALILYGAGVSTYLTLGLLTGLAQLIPYIGSIFAGVLVIGIPLLQGNANAALIVAILYIILNILQANLIVPMVLGREIKLHPVTIIIVLLIGAEFGGVLGMIVAVPIAAIISTTHQWYRELVEANEEPL